MEWWLVGCWSSSGLAHHTRRRWQGVGVAGIQVKKVDGGARLLAVGIEDAGDEEEEDKRGAGVVAGE